jgi:ferredoxin--NADP+ reductase
MTAGTRALADIPSNIYKPNTPLAAKVLEVSRLTPEDSPNDVRHVVFDIGGSELRYLEGQSLGVLPPGTDANGRAHKLRLYSIASPSYGDDGDSRTVSLCVKRVVYKDEASGEMIKGVCSNYICDLQPGDSVNVTGPVGKAFLMPEEKDANIVMIATGTGIAPFRAFLHNRYHARQGERGQSWLFFGVQHSYDLMYREELEAYECHDGYHLVTAISREQQTADGKRMYVQHRIAENAQALFPLFEQPNTFVYMCGLKGMETGILEGMTRAGEAQGVDWPALYDRMIAEKRWHIEVY